MNGMFLTSKTNIYHTTDINRLVSVCSPMELLNIMIIVNI